jgi:hypothetical protein
MQEPPKLTATLVKMEQAARDVSVGAINLEEFAAFIDRHERFFREKLDNVDKLDIPEDFREEMNAEMIAGKKGVALYLEGFDHFRRFITAHDYSLLQSGLDKMREGNDWVNEALRLNWETHYTYRQVTEDLLNEINPGGPKP